MTPVAGSHLRRSSYIAVRTRVGSSRPGGRRIQSLELGRGIVHCRSGVCHDLLSHTAPARPYDQITTGSGTCDYPAQRTMPAVTVFRMLQVSVWCTISLHLHKVPTPGPSATDSTLGGCARACWDNNVSKVGADQAIVLVSVLPVASKVGD